MIFNFIINNVSNFFKTGLIILFLNDYLKRNFPEKYTDFLVRLSYKIIYILSKGQILLLKSYNLINEFIDNNTYLNYIKIEIYNKINIVRNEICQIKGNGEIFVKYYENNEENALENYFENYFENDTNSIYIFSDNKGGLQNKSTSINKIILHSQPFIFEYEVSNIKFFLFEVIMEYDKSFKLYLNTNEYNFYIVNNIIDKRFIIYFLNQYNICNLKEYYDDLEKIEKINIKIIDHNVNIKEFFLTDKQYIKILKDDYIYTS